MDINGAVRLLLLLFLILNTYWDMKRRRVLLWSIVLFGISGIGLVFWFKNVSVLSSMGDWPSGCWLAGADILADRRLAMATDWLLRYVEYIWGLCRYLQWCFMGCCFVLSSLWF